MGEENPEPPDSVSGNQGRCYICDRDLSKLQEDYKVQRHGRYIREPERKGESRRQIAYFIGLCIWCDYQYCQK